MTVVVRPEILTSLRQVHEDVQRQVAGLDRFRALKAIEQTIADFQSLDDVAFALSDIRDRVQGQLDETPEYRALRTIERVMPELSEALALLEVPRAGLGDEGIERRGMEPEAVEPEDASSQAGRHTTAAVEIETPDLDEANESVPFESARPETLSLESASVSDTSLQGDVAKTEPVRPDLGFEPVPSLADSVAQLMAQSVPGAQKDRQAATVPQPQARSGDGPPHAEQAA